MCEDCGKESRFSPQYITIPSPICRVLLRQAVERAFCLARFNAGSIIAARIAMMAITTNNSMSVNAFLLFVLNMDLPCERGGAHFFVLG